MAEIVIVKMVGHGQHLQRIQFIDTIDLFFQRSQQHSRVPVFHDLARISTREGGGRNQFPDHRPGVVRNYLRASRMGVLAWLSYNQAMERKEPLATTRLNEADRQTLDDRGTHTDQPALKQFLILV